VRGAQERDAAATIPFVAIGGEKTRSRRSRADRLGERKSAFAHRRGENKNRKPKRSAQSPSRRRVALTVTRESLRNAVIARSTRAPARFCDARNRARRRFRVVRVPPCHAGARASEPRESAASARARPSARAREKKRAKARSFASARKPREPADGASRGVPRAGSGTPRSGSRSGARKSLPSRRRG